MDRLDSVPLSGCLITARGPAVPVLAPPRAGFCSTRCRTAAHRAAKRAAEELQDLPSPPDCIWVEVKDGDGRRARLYQAHYSHRLFGSQRNPGRRFVGPGEKIVLLAPDAGALFVWRRFFDHGQTTPRGTCCSVFRRETGTRRASELILNAERYAWSRWP